MSSTHDELSEEHREARAAWHRQAHPTQERRLSGALDENLPYLYPSIEQGPSLSSHETLTSYHQAVQAARTQAEEVQLSRLRRSESSKLAQGDEEAQVGWEPAFPNSADAEEVHEQALLDHGQAPEVLRNPGGLESAMGRAANYWHYGQGTPGERVADAAGALAHGIGMAQAFVDGNKRTAYHTTRGFLHSNGYGHLSPLEHDDDEFADHLIGHGYGTHSLEATQGLFRSRLRPEERSQ